MQLLFSSAYLPINYSLTITPCDSAYTGRIIDNVAEHTANEKQTVKLRRKWKDNIKMDIQGKMEAWI
jgi:hypothetical protein